MMPSVDHCISKPSDMTTLTNSIEVFDTYKHREDKDSDEESFHLPLDDDESELKYQESMKNGNDNELEDEILDKFASTTPGLEPVDSPLDEKLLNEEEDEKKNVVKENGLEPEENGLDASSMETAENGEEPTAEDTVEPEDQATKLNDVEDGKDDGEPFFDALENDVKTSENEDAESKDCVLEGELSAAPVPAAVEAGSNEPEAMDVDDNPLVDNEVEDRNDEVENNVDNDSKEVVDATAPSDDTPLEKDVPDVDVEANVDTVEKENTATEDSNNESQEGEAMELDSTVPENTDEATEKLVNKEVETEAAASEEKDEETEDLVTETKDDETEELVPEKKDEETEDPASEKKGQEEELMDTNISQSVDDQNTNQDKDKDLLSEIDNVMESINDVQQSLKEKDVLKNDDDKCVEEKDVQNNDDKCVEEKSESKEKDQAEKSESSNDSTKDQIEDSEDLFDISVIRDAAEDNAENARENIAYNEAFPDGQDDNDDYDDDHNDEDHNDEKLEEEDFDKVEDEEMDETVDMEKHDEHLKNDDVEIEESKLDIVSDGDSDSNNRTSVVDSNKEQVQGTSEISESTSETQCRLDEVTGDLISDKCEKIDLAAEITKSVSQKPMDIDSEDPEKRKTLKRPTTEDCEGATVKKSRTEEPLVEEIKEDEKPKEKPPLRALLSLGEFMRTRKNNRRLTMQDLEEFCLQKICEVLVHKGDLGDVQHQLKMQEQLIETMRKEIQQLTKQARDLEIVNKKLLNDLKQQQQCPTQKPLNPLKITRSVGLQVKFTPVFDPNKKKPASATPSQKTPAQSPSKNRNAANSTSGLSRQVSTISSAQKQQSPQMPSSKNNSPLLSQALHSRRPISNDSPNKTPPVRNKPIEPKPSSASVIDLTDEDDKRDKSKTVQSKTIQSKPLPPKTVPQKSITVPLRTTPVRVNPTQSIRLTSPQGKGVPISSVVTSSSPQVMYVVQSSPTNSHLGQKAVVVNFQSANGVLTSALNGSAVSVLPKQSNTIQLKTVMATKTMTTNRVIKPANKHPAPLPPPPVVRVNMDKPLKPIPPKPHLTIRKTDTGIILQWKMPYELDMYEVIASYQLYAYQETSAMPSTDMWRKVGDVKALALPMACTLTQFADKNKYYFAVRPVDIHKRIGVFSEPEEISL